MTARPKQRAGKAKARKVRDRRSVGERLVALFAPAMRLAPESRQELPRGRAKRTEARG